MLVPAAVVDVTEKAGTEAGIEDPIAVVCENAGIEAGIEEVGMEGVYESPDASDVSIDDKEVSV